MKKANWFNKRYGKQGYVGSYAYPTKGDRYLVLTGETTGRKFEVESWEAAKKLGWVKK